MNVIDMTLFILIPISWLVSKSLETARIAIPIFVCFISSESRMTSAIVRNGVMTVTIFVVESHITMDEESHGMEGYTFASPPVK